MSTRSASYNASALNEFANDLLGQIYNPDDQCEAYNGKGSYMCRVSFNLNCNADTAFQCFHWNKRICP